VTNESERERLARTINAWLPIVLGIVVGLVLFWLIIASL
jgi:hypothetical protein